MRTLFKAADGCFLIVSEQERRKEGKGREGAMKEGSLNDSPDFDQRWVFV